MKARRKPSAGDNGIDYNELAQKIAPRVATLVLARLATALGAVEAPFSTRPGYAPPEFHGRPRAWRETASRIEGAVRIGRWWSVPRDRYAAWIDAQSSRVSLSAQSSTSTSRTPADVARDLGFRVIDGTGRPR